MTTLALKPFPRLYTGADAANLKTKLHSPWMETQAAAVLADADRLVRAKPIAEGEAESYQHGTRAIWCQLMNLTAAWALTEDSTYRKAAMRHLGNIMNWNQISCEARVNTPVDTQMGFCLSYGEHCSVIAQMYDLFRNDITAEEQQVFFDVLNKFYLKAALRCMDKPGFWVNAEWSNWNGVCCGGMGMMALAPTRTRVVVSIWVPMPVMRFSPRKS